VYPDGVEGYWIRSAGRARGKNSGERVLRVPVGVHLKDFPPFRCVAPVEPEDEFNPVAFPEALRCLPELGQDFDVRFWLLPHEADGGYFEGFEVHGHHALTFPAKFINQGTP